MFRDVIALFIIAPNWKNIPPKWKSEMTSGKSTL